MGWIKRKIESFKNGRVKRLFPNSENIIEYAFTSGGVDYYRFADYFSLPYERGLMAVSVYHELDMRCTREYLKLHTEAVGEILQSKEINIFKLNELNEQLKQRLEMVADTELMYKLASVVYFDRSENPAKYETTKAEEKIAKWKKDKGINDFFSQKPLRELLPFLENVDIDLDTYSQLMEQLNAIHWERLRLLKSKK